jgi:hypothetical protein
VSDEKRSKAGASRKSSDTVPLRIAAPEPSSWIPAAASPRQRRPWFGREEGWVERDQREEG